MNTQPNIPDGKTYPIRTLQDIFNLPTCEQAERCLDELTKGLLTARATADMIVATAKHLAEKNGKEFPAGPYISWPEVVEWCDDGKGEVGADFKTHEGDTFLSMRITKKS